MDAWTYDKIDEAIKILDEISHSLKRLADYYTPTEKADTPQTDLVEDSDDLVKDLAKDTDTHEKAVEALAYLIGQKKPSYSSGSNSYGEQVQTDKTDSGWKQGE